MRRDGDRLIIEMPARIGLLALLSTLEPIEEDFGEIEDSLPGDIDF